MNKLLLVALISVLTHWLYAQNTNTQLTTQANVIRNETSPGGNTKTRIADMFQGLINSKQSMLAWSATGVDTYSATISGITSIGNTWYVISFVNGNTIDDPTLNINGLGAAVINAEIGDIVAGKRYLLAYNGTSFDIVGGNEGGAVPTLQQVITAGSVLTGNNAITGPRGLSIETGVSAGGINGLDVSSDQMVLRSDTFYIQDIAGGNTIYSDNGTDKTGLARGSDQIEIDGTTGITLTTDNTDGIKVSGGGTLAQTSGLLTKSQVGDYITSRQFKKSVKASSTANIDLNNAGASMDGITLATQDRVLLKDQSTGSQNGIYSVVSLTPTVLNRVGDFSSSTFEGVLTNTLVLVDQGTTNGGKAYRLSTTGTITIGTTALTFEELSAASLALKAQLYPSTRTETASTTGVLADAGGYVEINSASATTFTVPPASSVAYPDNTTITIHNYGAGDVTVTAGSGVTFRLRSGSTLTVPQYSVAVVKKKTGDEWYVWSGSLPLNSTTLVDKRIPYSDINGQLTDRSGFQMDNGKMSVDRILLAAGTTTAGTSPEKYTSGPLMTTIEAGAVEFNGGHYRSSTALNRTGQGGPIAHFIADVQNSGTSETDIQTYTTKASTLGATGEMLTFDYAMVLNDATATAQVKVLFAGTTIGDTGALTVSATGAVIIKGWIIRTGASTARASVIISSPTTSTAVYTAETDLTSLTFTNTNILKTTATAGGAGGGSSDITGKMGIVYWWPAVAN